MLENQIVIGKKRHLDVDLNINAARWGCESNYIITKICLLAITEM